MTLKLYKYHNNPDELLQPDIKYKFGGISIGVFNGKEIIVSPGIYEKILMWDDAVSYCNDLDIGGYRDWYLPDKDELNFMYENSDKLQEIDKFDNKFYWSSTENNYNVWGLFFNNGSLYSGGKNYSYCVRAIRNQ